MKKRRISLISAIIVTVLTLSFTIISIFTIFNQKLYDNLTQKQGSKVLMLLYERAEFYFQELLHQATSLNEFIGDHMMVEGLPGNKDLSEMEDYLRYLVMNNKEKYPQIAVMGYGDELGRYIGFRINPDREINLMLKDQRTDDKLNIYSSDTTLSQVVAQYDDYDLFSRSWYRQVKEKPETQWSDIYVNYDEKMDLTISVMSPVFTQGNFYGTIVSDVSLNLINDYLENDRRIENGIVYVIDQNKNVIASSEKEEVTQAMKNPVILSSLEQLKEGNELQNDFFSFEVDREKYVGISRQLKKPQDIGLGIVVLIPEHDLLSDIETQQSRSLILSMIVVLLSIILGIWFLTFITQPIRKATDLAKAVSAGDFSITIEDSKLELYETTKLVRALNHMSAELESAFSTIKENELMLEKKIHEKTLELQQTYEELLEQEKFASLGSLVAGVSHEINTPLGVAVSACSYIKKQNEGLYEMITKGQLSKGKFINYLETTEESMEILTSNLNRASELIKSFKQISVDQSGSTFTKFYLKDYLESIFTTLRHEYKNKAFKYEIICDPELQIRTYPGAISQVFTNLIMNSLRHGLSENKPMFIKIHVLKNKDQVEFYYEDDGKGIPAENLKHIFDPFFTTKRNQGGSGLGLSIIYNIIVTTLGGTITCESQLDQGVLFTIIIPYINKGRGIG